MRFLDLGPLRIERDNGEQITAGGRRPTGLLTMLLMHANQRVSVDDLIEAVWGEDARESSSGALETHVWRLRRILEPSRPRGAPASTLVNEFGGYRLLVTTDQVDSLRFEALGLDVLDLLATDQPARALARADEALAVWRGRPFDILSDAYWATGPIARLEEIRAQIQERRVDALLATNQPTRALADLEMLLAGSPYRERLWGQRMLALHRSGRTEEALQAYRSARETLQDEVGIDPGPELKDLHHRILDADPALRLVPDAVATGVAVPAAAGGLQATRRPTEVHLPRPRTLIGRSKDLADVVRLLPHEPLVSLVGPAGCGKTRLAVEAARAAAQHFPDGVWFVDLTVTEDGAAVAATVATTLGLAVPPHTSALDALARHATDHRSLVVIDNCEHVLDAVAEVAEAVTGQGQELALLATSREPLGVTDERFVRLGPLPLVGLDGQASPAVELFLSRWERSRGRPDVEPPALGLVERICRGVDGIPLALELAAGLAEAYTVEEVAERVLADPSQLSSIGRGHERHHRTLFGAIDASYRLLGPAERQLHRQLSVLSGPFTTATAVAVAAPLNARTVSGLLAQLVHRSMLTSLGSSRSDGPTRFTQLATVRGHASYLLDADEERSAAESRQTAFALDLVRGRPLSGRPEDAAFLDALDDDIITMRAVLQRSVDTGDPDSSGAELARNMLSYWYYRGRGLEGRRWLEQLIDNPSLAELDRALTQLALASIIVTQGSADRARALVTAALPVAAAAATDDRAVEVAEILLCTATAFTYAPDRDLMHALLGCAYAVAENRGDADLRVVHAAAACMVDALVDPVDATFARARSVYDEAKEVENLWAGWLACSSGSAAAQRVVDPERGMWWSRRLLEQQHRLGARAPLAQMETWGGFLAMAGHHEPAVHVFSAIHQQTRRNGLRFPRQPLTLEQLDQARRHLGDRSFETAWRTGPAKRFDELIDAV
jgi:predicted ATPase/DNA-binding SARP family transcriptional activator